MTKRLRIFSVGFFSFTVTAILAVFVLNFTSGEKKIEQQLPRIYGTQDPQFKRAMGSLIGPGIVAGAAQWRPDLSGDAASDPQCKKYHHF